MKKSINTINNKMSKMIDKTEDEKVILKIPYRYSRNPNKVIRVLHISVEATHFLSFFESIVFLGSIIFPIIIDK